MRRKVILSIDPPLTDKERKEFKKTHPGYRLCFTLRYPRGHYWLMCIPSILMSLAAIIISIVQLLK